MKILEGKAKFIEQYLYTGGEASEEFLEETAPLIGYIVQSFNALERLLESRIAEIICERSHQTGAIIMSGFSYEQKRQLLSRLLKLTEEIILGSEKNNDKFALENKELLKNLEDCGTLRNLVVHVEYEDADADGFCYHKTKIQKEYGNKIMREEHVQITTEGLKKIRDYIDETYSNLEKYWDFIHDRNN